MPRCARATPRCPTAAKTTARSPTASTTTAAPYSSSSRRSRSSPSSSFSCRDRPPPPPPRPRLPRPGGRGPWTDPPSGVRSMPSPPAPTRTRLLLLRLQAQPGPHQPGAPHHHRRHRPPPRPLHQPLHRLSPPRVPAMAHGGYPRRGAAVRRPKSSASAAADRKRKRAAATKTASLKNQIGSTERFLRKVLAVNEPRGLLARGRDPLVALCSAPWCGLAVCVRTAERWVFGWEPLGFLAN
jgi:hypothetical protein